MSTIRKKIKQGQIQTQEKDFLHNIYNKNWVVYFKRPFGAPNQVIKYIGRYSHKVAFTNRRLLDFRPEKCDVCLQRLF